MKKSLLFIGVLLFVTVFMSCRSTPENIKSNDASSTITATNEATAQKTVTDEATVQKTVTDEATAEKTITDEEIQQAIDAAKDWLVLIDAGKYPESWDTAASLLKKAVPKEQWVKTLNGLLPLYGKAVKRELISADYYTELPGAPDGEYVVIQFKTSFENKENSIETITPMKEDGKWRVSGYYIK